MWTTELELEPGQKVTAPQHRAQGSQGAPQINDIDGYTKGLSYFFVVAELLYSRAVMMI